MLSWSHSWAKAKAYPKPKLIQSQRWSKSKPKPKQKVSQSHGYGYNWYWHCCRPPTGWGLNLNWFLTKQWLVKTIEHWWTRYENTVRTSRHQYIRCMNKECMIIAYQTQSWILLPSENVCNIYLSWGICICLFPCGSCGLPLHAENLFKHLGHLSNWDIFEVMDACSTL